MVTDSDGKTEKAQGQADWKKLVESTECGRVPTPGAYVLVRGVAGCLRPVRS